MGITENEIPEDADQVAYNLLDHIGITRDKADRTMNTVERPDLDR